MKQPSWVPPMLATLVKKTFSSPDWIYEKKFDGVRCLVCRNGSSVSLYSRNHKKMNSAYPEIREAFEKQKSKYFIADGEIIGIKGKKEGFHILQARMNLQKEEEAIGTGVKVAIYLFDLLFFEGRDLRHLPLIERKKILKKSFKFKNPIFYTEHVVKEGEKYFKTACKKGWEGVIAKRANSFYVGKRSTDWQKFKAVHSQEFVICGYTSPQGSRIGFGAILIGYYEKGKLHYAGKVGTGYTERFLADLYSKLKKIQTKNSPFSSEIKEKNAIWVKPKYIGEVGFTEWTPDGKLRHPTFLGLRSDKSPKSVIRERAK